MRRTMYAMVRSRAAFGPGQSRLFTRAARCATSAYPRTTIRQAPKDSCGRCSPVGVRAVHMHGSGDLGERRRLTCSVRSVRGYPWPNSFIAPWGASFRSPAFGRPAGLLPPVAQRRRRAHFRGCGRSASRWPARPRPSSMRVSERQEGMTAEGAESRSCVGPHHERCGARLPPR